MIAALDTDERVYFALTHANTDSDIMLLFFSHLVQRLDAETPGWQEDTVFLLDGAKYHTSSETRLMLQKLGLKVVFSGPYSYSGAPIELMFGGLKQQELNKDNQLTSKK